MNTDRDGGTGSDSLASRSMQPEPTQLATCSRWKPIFEDLLKIVDATGSHGQLVDVREPLRKAVTATRPLVMMCPHPDDGAITAACLLHEFAVDRGLPVIEVLVFAGERNVDAPWLNHQKKVTVREKEFRLECDVLNAEPVCWDLDAYRSPGYRPTASDIEKIVCWFEETKPGALIVPPVTDAHRAHRMTRAFAAIGLIGAGLTETLVLSGWTPWGPLPQPNAFFTYNEEAERNKQWAINCHASQVRLTDYTEFCMQLGRAYSALTREWSEGHRLASGRGSRGVDQPAGVELFQIETYQPSRADLRISDPIQIALGIVGGHLESPTLADIVDSIN